MVSYVEPEALLSATLTRALASQPAPESQTRLSEARRPTDFDGVFGLYFPHVLRWARAMGGPRNDLDDVVQETFLVVRRKLAQFEGEDLAPWIYRITQLVVRDYRRRAWFRRFFTTPDDQFAEIESNGAGPVEALEHGEARRILQRALERLTPKQRSVFVLYEIEGYSSEEIAALERVPLNTVYTRLHAARKSFRAFVARATGLSEDEQP